MPISFLNLDAIECMRKFKNIKPFYKIIFLISWKGFFSHHLVPSEPSIAAFTTLKAATVPGPVWLLKSVAV